MVGNSKHWPSISNGYLFRNGNRSYQRDMTTLECETYLHVAIKRSKGFRATGQHRVLANVPFPRRRWCNSLQTSRCKVSPLPREGVTKRSIGPQDDSDRWWDSYQVVRGELLHLKSDVLE